MISTPMHDPTAEKAMLGAILRKPSVLDDVRQVVPVKAIFDPLHRAIYREFLSADGLPLDDPTLVYRYLREQNVDVTPNCLAEILETTASPANAGHYAAAILESATRRDAIELGNRLATTAANHHTRPDEILSEVRAKLDAMQMRSEKFPVRQWCDSLHAYLEEMEAHEIKPGISIGFPSFERDFGPLVRSELTVIGARTSVGKTSLGLQIAEYVAAKHLPALYCSLEMSEREVTIRRVTMSTPVDNRDLRQGTLNRRDLSRIKALSEVASHDKIPLYHYCPPRATLADIAARARRLKASIGLDLLVVDYLQIVNGERAKAQQRYEQLGEISSGLKELAKELDIAVIGQAQLNNRTGNERPTLGNLRESGNLEQDADNVILLHRPDAELVDGEMEWLVAKYRNGSTGAITMRFEGGKHVDPAAPYPEFA